MKFPERLKALRLEKDITQKELALCIGVTSTSIQRFEYGTGKPALDTVVALADFFNVSVDYLLGRVDNPNLHVFKDNPKITNEDFLEKLILDTRINHKQRIAKAEGKIEEPAIEYADNLLRHYHKALLSALRKAGITFEE